MIYHRVDAEKDFMGLMTFSGEEPTLREAKIAKNYLDGILTSIGENLLIGNGTVSHLQAMEKAQTEYKRYKAKTLSSVEKDYLENIKLLEQKGKQQK